MNVIFVYMKKLVKEYLNEKFIEDTDPIHDMNIGLYHRRNFDSSEEYAEFMIKYLPAILGEERIPEDYLHGGHMYFNGKYDTIIDPYLNKYITVKNRGVENYDNRILHQMLKEKGLKEF